MFDKFNYFIINIVVMDVFFEVLFLYMMMEFMLYFKCGWCLRYFKFVGAIGRI